MPPRAQTPEMLQKQPFKYDATEGKLYWAVPRPKVNVGEEAGWVEPYKNTFYRRVTVGYRRAYVHRLVWEMHYGEIPDGLMVDHIDGNGLNNRLANLRLVSPQGNARNARRPKTNTSGISGVSLDRRVGKWRAYTRHAGKQKALGYFDSKIAAARAVDDARHVLGYSANHGRSQ